MIFSRAIFLKISGLKLVIAFLQLSASVMLYRSMGAGTYGNIILIVAQIELILLFSLPGLQKLALSNVVNFRPIKTELLLKVILIIVCLICYTIYLPTLTQFCIFLLLAGEHLNSFLRIHIHARKKFSLVTSLDMIKPSFFIITIATFLMTNAQFSVTSYLVTFLVAVLLEMIINIFFLIKSLSFYSEYRRLNLKTIISSSGFSFSNGIGRRFPILVGGFFSNEVVASIGIINQFLLLSNYMISAVMTQLSLTLLENKDKRGIYKEFQHLLILSVPCYFAILFLFDLILIEFIGIVFNHKLSDGIKFIYLAIVPVYGLVMQYFFYNNLNQGLGDNFIIFSIILSGIVFLATYYTVRTYAAVIPIDYIFIFSNIPYLLCIITVLYILNSKEKKVDK